jgi:hypothetical protein
MSYNDLLTFIKAPFTVSKGGMKLQEPEVSKMQSLELKSILDFKY